MSLMGVLFCSIIFYSMYRVTSLVTDLDNNVVMTVTSRQLLVKIKLKLCFDVFAYIYLSE